jgi:hypothetical protein
VVLLCTAWKKQPSDTTSTPQRTFLIAARGQIFATCSAPLIEIENGASHGFIQPDKKLKYVVKISTNATTGVDGIGLRVVRTNVGV